MGAKKQTCRDRDRERCWLVGLDQARGVFHVVEAELVGEPIDGRQTVNTRLGCHRSAMFETVPVELIHATEQSAIERREALEAEQEKPTKPKKVPWDERGWHPDDEQR